jgi:hypothetical protein
MRQAERWRDTTGWRLPVALLFVALLLQSGAARASTGIEVRNATTQLVDGVWFLDADISYTLNETALEALASGLELEIELTIRLTQWRRLAWDPEFAELKQRYTLQFHALTERYILRNLNSGEEATFGSLEAALNEVGTVRGLPVIDDALLNPDKRYHVNLRTVMDIKELGGPLGLFRLFWNDWRSESDWIRWRL